MWPGLVLRLVLGSLGGAQTTRPRALQCRRRHRVHHRGGRDCDGGGGLGDGGGPRDDEQRRGRAKVELPHRAGAHLAHAASLVRAHEGAGQLQHRLVQLFPPRGGGRAHGVLLAHEGEGVARPLLDLAEAQPVRRPDLVLVGVGVGRQSWSRGSGLGLGLGSGVELGSGRGAGLGLGWGLGSGQGWD